LNWEEKEKREVKREKETKADVCTLVFIVIEAMK
jgi:hypothetical protein